MDLAKNLKAEDIAKHKNLICQMASIIVGDLIRARLADRGDMEALHPETFDRACDDAVGDSVEIATAILDEVEERSAT